MTNNNVLEFRWEVIARGDKGLGVRSRHCFAHDREAKATVLVGGIIWDDGTLRSDTWELRNGAWHSIDCSPVPPARHRGAMVYDAVRGCCVLFGGQGSRWQMLDDTWLYSNRPIAEPSTIGNARIGVLCARQRQKETANRKTAPINRRKLNWIRLTTALILVRMPSTGELTRGFDFRASVASTPMPNLRRRVGPPREAGSCRCRTCASVTSDLAHL